MRKKVALSCVDCGERNYATTINKTTQDDRLQLKKFCKTCNRHTNHKETK